MVGRRRWHFFPNNEFSGSGNGNARGAANRWWFGCNVKLGMGGNFGGNKGWPEEDGATLSIQSIQLT